MIVLNLLLLYFGYFFGIIFIIGNVNWWFIYVKCLKMYNCIFFFFYLLYNFFLVCEYISFGCLKIINVNDDCVMNLIIDIYIYKKRIYFDLYFICI